MRAEAGRSTAVGTLGLRTALKQDALKKDSRGLCRGVIKEGWLLCLSSWARVLHLSCSLQAEMAAGLRHGSSRVTSKVAQQQSPPLPGRPDRAFVPNPHCHPHPATQWPLPSPGWGSQKSWSCQTPEQAGEPRGRPLDSQRFPAPLLVPQAAHHLDKRPRPWPPCPGEPRPTLLERKWVET